MDQRRPESSLHEGTHYPSPFTKVLALGYYDGPTEGLVQGGEGGPVYRFHMLAWDGETQDLRVFGLAPCPPDSLSRLAAVCERYEPARWPVWVPSWHEGMEAETKQLLSEAGLVGWVVAAHDLLGQVLAARTVTPEEVAQTTDWSTFLGLGTQCQRVATDQFSAGE
jgi:hypothetical protein